MQNNEKNLSLFSLSPLCPTNKYLTPNYLLISHLFPPDNIPGTLTEEIFPKLSKVSKRMMC